MINKLLIAVVIFAIVLFIGFLISNLEVTDIEEKEISNDFVSLAEEKIISLPTFKERGGSDLEHVRTVEIGEGVFELTFTFNSSFAGYGKVGEDEMSAQVITPHTVVVVIENGEVVSVVIDEHFDELSQEENTSSNNEEEVLVYFVTFEEDIVPLKRKVVGDEIEKKTLLLLLEGVTEEEKKNGYSTAINEGVKINNFEVKEKVVMVDFSEELEVSGGSALVTMIRNQIEKTLLQFEIIESVVISINGETEEILQP
jgi:spore germination protein GerM